MATIEQQVDLAPYTTFGVHAHARFFTTIQSLDELQTLRQSVVFLNSRRLILGGGSNVLFTKDFDGLVIINQLKGIHIDHETEDTITLSVASGEDWHGLVMYCVHHDWGGIENLALIPGTVGAAPMQNIGAYGVEAGEVIDQVTALEFETGEVRTFTKEECRFGYRESIFKNTWRDKLFISSVTLSLTKKNHRLRTSYGAIMDVLKDKKITTPSLRDITNAVISIRQSKLPDPRVLGNAGSFFKNPSIPQSQYQALLTSYPTMPGYPVENQFVKIPAAWLIEHCGWKGKRIRSAGVHQHQALVLVNYGDATGDELLYVAEQIQHDVFTQFGIQLTREVNVI